MSEAALTKDDILNADDCKVEPLDMREFGWPGTIYIGILRGNEMEKVANLYKDGVDKTPDYVAFMASLFIRDQNGVRVFGNDDYKALNHKSGVALTHIVERGVALNKIDDKEIDDAEKN